MGILGLFKPNVRRMKVKKDVEGLIKALNYERDHDVRMGAAEALGEIGDKRAVEPLIQALKADSYLQARAAWALGEIGDKRAVKPLIPALQGELDTEVTLYATQTLIKIGEPAVKPLIQALKRKDSDVRARAAEALGEIGDKRAVGPLIQALKADSYLQARAAEALVQIGEPAVEPLFQALEDVNTEGVALRALRNIRTFGKLGEGALRKLKKWDDIIV